MSELKKIKCLMLQDEISKGVVFGADYKFVQGIIGKSAYRDRDCSFCAKERFGILLIYSKNRYV